MQSPRLLCLAAIATAGAPAFAQTATALLREGDIVQPQNVAASLLGNPAANDVGGFAIAINAGSGISAFWGNATGGAGSVMRAEGVVGPYTQTAIEAFYGIGNLGQIAYSPTTNGGPAPSTGADTVWQDDAAIAFQGLPVTEMPGQFWSFASRPTTTTQTGEPWWVSGITSTAGGSTQNRGLFRGMTGTPVLIGGATVPGASEAISSGATSQFDFQVSGDGSHWVGTFTFVAAAAIDTAPIFDGSVFMAGGSAVREGSPVPASVGGMDGENWQNFGVYGINNAGTVLIVGDTSGAAATDAFVFLGDEFVMREGDMVGGFPTTGAFTGADLNESGDWVVLWNVTSGATREAIIFNGQLLLKETDLVDFDGDGTPEVALTDISASEVALGERIDGFVDIYFVGDTSATSNVGEALFRIHVPVGPVCGTSDFDGDGDFGTDADIEAFFACLGGNCCALCFPGGSDFDGDGDSGTDADIEAFFRVLGGGAC